MTMLEASLRKLVREEAVSAAVETVDVIREGVNEKLGEIRGDLKQIANGEFAIAMKRLTTWSRMNVPRPEGVSDQPMTFLQVGDGAIGQMRQAALELAAKHHGPDIDATLKAAEKFARFLIDGCLDGMPRPIAELPAYPTAEGDEA